MPHAFELLQLPVRLVLTDEEIRTAFREAGKIHHPDAGGDTENFSLLQSAYSEILSPARRLKAWLNISQIPGDERGVISPELMDLFSKVGACLQQADELIRQRESTRSALAKAMLEGKTFATREEIERIQSDAQALVDKRLHSFPGIEEGTVDAWQVLRDLVFLEKWQAQLRDRYGKLW
jgi:hypothetical protein